MITFFAEHNKAGGIRRWLDTWAGEFRARCDVVTHHELVHRRRFQRGPCVFLSPYPESAPPQLIAQAARQLEDQGCRILNRPGGFLLRYDLLRALHDAGLNDYNVYRLDQLTGAERYPLFLRYAHLHVGPITDPLHTPDELRRAIDALPHDDRRQHAIAVEYRDTRSPDGIYRKYSVFRVGDTYFPRHMLFAGDWVAKGPKQVTDAQAAEETEFIHTNPHLDHARRVFELARIDYGRIDYSIADGRVCVWEINQNPVPIQQAWQFTPERVGLQVIAMARLTAAFADLDDANLEATGGAGGTDDVTIHIDRDTERLAGLGARHRITRSLSAALHRTRLAAPLDRAAQALSRLTRYDR